MAKHDQKTKDEHMACSFCRNGVCDRCIDVVRALFSQESVCKCKKQGHMGEPLGKQILDPETGTVHAPGLVVTNDGQVFRDSSV